MLQMAAKFTEETEKILTQELLIQEAWCGWEESLQAAQRMWRVGEAVFQDESTWEPLLFMKKQMQDKQENLNKWKVHFLGEPEGFEEEEIEVDAFGMDEWDK